MQGCCSPTAYGVLCNQGPAFIALGRAAVDGIAQLFILHASCCLPPGAEPGGHWQPGSCHGAGAARPPRPPDGLRPARTSTSSSRSGTPSFAHISSGDKRGRSTRDNATRAAAPAAAAAAGGGVPHPSSIPGALGYTARCSLLPGSAGSIPAMGRHLWQRCQGCCTPALSAVPGAAAAAVPVCLLLS
jgi:hypothetical protein